MKKDIPISKVENVAIAIVPEDNKAGQEEWNVYLLNLKEDAIETVIVSSRGYGEMEAKKVKTTTLRQMFGNISAKTFIKIEMIDKKLFTISNEFWISFWHRGILYDKKYIFVSESITPNNLTKVPLLNKMGVMIK